MRPTYAQAETLRQALDAIKSPAGNVRRSARLLIITDYASQVRDMLSLAKLVDVPGNSDGIYTIPVKHADAAQARREARRTLLGRQRGRGSRGAGREAARSRSRATTSLTPSKILVDDRTNTLIVVVERGRLPARQGARRAARHLARHRGRHVDPRLSARERARRGAREDAQRRAPGPAPQQRAAAASPARRAGSAERGPRHLARGSGPRDRRQADELAAS